MAEITGRHVLLASVGAFGVIIAVNLVMAWKAISTFPGLEVKNSYVASQEFDARRAAQEALGWTMATTYESGRLRIAFTDRQGQPVEVAELDVLVGRRTVANDDARPEFIRLEGAYEAEVPLGKGNWLVRVFAKAKDGTLFEQRTGVFVKG